MASHKIGLIGIVGEESKKDFWSTMQRVADIGYQGIEGPSRLLVGDVSANLRRFHDMGLSAVTVSASREQLRDELDKVAADAIALQAPHVSVWWSPCSSKEEVLRDADLYNSAGERLTEQGLKLCYHNHDHEFKIAFDGVCAMDTLIENTDPRYVHFEIDIAWVTYGREDPSSVLHRLTGRVPAVHVKDFSTIDEPGRFTAVGTGVVKIKDAVEAAIATGVEWMVVEQDKLLNLTPFETATVSYLNLKEMGLV